MTFQPVVPLTGYVGWRFLQRTLESQQDTFNQSQPIVRDTTYFRENIANITTAEELVADRRLLTVALGAFGLDDDINNKYFIEKVLSDGTVDDDALANRLSDKRYLAFTSAFGLGQGDIPRTGLPLFTDDIIARFEKQQFAQAVGDSNQDMRLALNTNDTLGDIIDDNQTDTGRWFSIMGNAPLRAVFENALGLPSSIGAIDIDQQLEAFRDRSNAVFGTDQVSDFLDPDMQEDLIRLFLVRSEASQLTGASGGSIALTLLQSVASPLS